MGPPESPVFLLEETIQQEEDVSWVLLIFLRSSTLVVVLTVLYCTVLILASTYLDNYRVHHGDDRHTSWYRDQK